MNYAIVMAALADSTRRTLFERLSERALSVTELAAGLPVSRPAVSQHLKVLTEAELVEMRRDGARRIYSARPEALGELRAYVDGLWQDVLASYAATPEKDNG